MSEDEWKSRVGEALEAQCEMIDDDHQRLTRLEWAVIAIGVCLLAMFGLIVWGLLR